METPDSGIKHLPKDLATWIVDACRDPVFVFQRETHYLEAYNMAAHKHLARKIWIQRMASSPGRNSEVQYCGGKYSFIRYIEDSNGKRRDTSISQDDVDRAIEAWSSDIRDRPARTNARRKIFLALNTDHGIDPWVEPVACNKSHYALLLRGAPLLSSDRFQRHMEGLFKSKSTSQCSSNNAWEILSSWILFRLDINAWCIKYLDTEIRERGGRTLYLNSMEIHDGSPTALWDWWRGVYLQKTGNDPGGTRGGILGEWAKLLGVATRDGENREGLLWKLMLLDVPGE